MATYPGLYGLLAEFETPTELVAAVHSARQTGYTRMDSFPSKSWLMRWASGGRSCHC